MKYRRVLIITYRYPPMLSMGSLRLANLTQRLPDFDWHPVVVTVKPKTGFYMRGGELPVPDGVDVFRTMDRSFHQTVVSATQKLRQVVAGTQRSVMAENAGKMSFPVKLLYDFYKHTICFPDEVVPWYLFEYAKIKRIVQEVQPDIIYSSSLPNTCHLIASRLSKELNLPWVAEFRDLWSQNHVWRRFQPLGWLEESLERRVIRRANALVTVSPLLASQLRELHKKQIWVVQNGFDEQATTNTLLTEQRKFVVAYTGLIYPHTRAPKLLFDVLEDLLRSEAIDESELEVRFFGRKLGYVSQLLSKYPLLSKVVLIGGEIDHESALREQRHASVLLLLESTSTRARGVFTGKLFEYLGASRPILAFGPKGGAIDMLLQETKAGELVTNIEEAENVLQNWIEQYKEKGYVQFLGDEKAMAKYSWQEQARKVACVLDQIYEQNQST